MTKLHARYGSKWADMWRGVDPDRIVNEWSLELAGFTQDEIMRGMVSLRSSSWPPTLPEFMALCRPPLEAERTYIEAVEGINARDRGNAYRWTHPAIYWAAVEFGTADLMRSNWRYAQARWRMVMERQMQATEWPEVPKPPTGYLPEPKGKQSPEMRQHINNLLHSWGQRVADTGPAPATSTH